MNIFFAGALLFAAQLCFALDSVEDQNLASRIQALELRVEQLSAEKPMEAPDFEILKTTDQTLTQLGPAASKIYFRPEAKWQLGLSSELFTYEIKDQNRANVMSVAPVLAFRPQRRIIFNSQFNFENGGSESRDTVALQKGQSIVQMAYLDWLVHDSDEVSNQAGLRVGHQLIPFGWVNTRQDSVTYLGVLKPELEREIIPATWHENGISLWVDRPRADLQIGVFNSLNARGMRGETFLAGGRSQGQNAAAENLMGVFRMNTRWGGFGAGASFAVGGMAQNDPALSGTLFRLGEIHAHYLWRRLELKAMTALGQVEDAYSISVLNGTSMGSEARGSSFQAAYNLGSDQQALWIFWRETNYNLQSSMPEGILADPQLDKAARAFGLSYIPIANLVLKADYVSRRSSGDSSNGEIAFAIGAIF